ncbi:MAG TPA: phosphoglucomutase/phosphomannomutase family protein [Spirochaetia bacterium]|nr:phosphoglucomutase/phosphomannomutase family protein [Spirochaetia bacterium]
MEPISFGTDGWRGIMARDFVFDRLQLVAAAVAGYVESRGLAPRGMVVGYDNRFLSEHFARAVAEVLTGRGIPVFMPATSVPTPVAAFAVRHLKAAGAVMLTASHNPPEYNGIKFIPDYAGPALPPITRAIEENIQRLAPGFVPGQGDLDQAEAAGLWRELDVKAAYLDHLGTLVDLPAVGRAGRKIICDPMFGAGTGYLEEALARAGVPTETLHGYRDPLFGGHLPDPTAGFLGPLRERVTAAGAVLGLALDGDADRFGLIDADGTFVAPNTFLPLLYRYLLVDRGIKGPATRSVATTHLLDRLAAKYGQTVLETPVGFKYIGQNLLEQGCVLGGEESGGLSIKGHVPEKDGILAGLLAAEMVAVTGQSLGELSRRLAEEVGSLTSTRVDLHTDAAGKQKVLDRLTTYRPASLGGVPVAETSTMDGVRFLLQDGGWALVRASGTEPVFRLYVEAATSEQSAAMVREVRASLQI